MDMFANGFSLELLLDMLRRRVWMAIVPFFGIFTIGISLLVFLPNIYTAKAIIRIEGQAIPSEFVRPTVTMGAERRFQSISQDLLSKSRLEKLAEEFGLYPDLRLKGTPGERIAAAMRQDIVIQRVGGGSEKEKDSMSFEISYTNLNPEKAMQIANNLASGYVEENTKIRERLSLVTTDFLQQQLDEAKKRLEKHEQQIMLYKQQHLGELPEQIEANFGTLEVLQKQMGTISENLAKARERHSILTRWADGGVAIRPLDTLTPGEKNNSAPVSLQTQLAELKVRFSDKHPDVIRMKKLIAALEEEKKQVSPNSSDVGSSASRQSVSPAQVEQAEVSGEIQRLTADLAKVNQDIAVYKQRVENTAKREQELYSLTRDYETTRELYRSLLKRYEEASMADDMEKEQRSERFRLLEPATYPQMPSAPHRLRLLFITLVLSLGAAVGGVFLREIQDTAFHRVEDLKKFVKVPVLVSITQIVTARDRYSRRFNTGLGVAALIVVLILLVNVSYRVANGNEQLVRVFGTRD
jgi:polysaccharide biosynthesis transport protein